MPASYIQPARFLTNVPAVRTPGEAAVPTFKRGYPVVQAPVTGLVDECPAGTPMIYGFALQDNQTNPGFQAANSPATFTGRNDTASIALAVDTTEFSSPLVNNSAVIVVPTAADVGAQYGLSKQGTLWFVDQNLVGPAARVVITAIDILNSLVFFRVLKAYQQMAQ